MWNPFSICDLWQIRPVLTIWPDSKIFFFQLTLVFLLNGGHAAVVGSTAKLNIVHYWLLHLQIVTISKKNISTVDKCFCQ